MPQESAHLQSVEIVQEATGNIKQSDIRSGIVGFTLENAESLI